jgi:disulfide bond formation protein DsbB
MKKAGKVRFGYFLGFLLIVFLLALAEYLEVYKGMIPCPLCMLQRIVLMVLGILFLIAMMFPMKAMGSFFIGLSSLLTCVGGILLSGRQVWLQHAPPVNLGECGASLTYMFHTLPLIDVLKHIWTGGIECSQQGWAFMHLSLAEWSLIGFVGFFVFAVLQLKRSLSK